MERRHAAIQERASHYGLVAACLHAMANGVDDTDGALRFITKHAPPGWPEITTTDLTTAWGTAWTVAAKAERKTDRRHLTLVGSRGES